MRITIYHRILLIIFSLHLPLFVTSSRLISRPPDSQCTRPDPNTLRSDQMTVVISGYSEHRIPLLRSITAAYSTSPLVAAVILLWCNPSTPSRTLSDLTQNLSAAVLRAPSSRLNNRFYPWEFIQTRAVLICDDDTNPIRILSPSPSPSRDPTRIGLLGSSLGHTRTTSRRRNGSTQWRRRSTQSFSKFMIVNVEYLEKYSCSDGYAEARKIVEEMNNCEDILMNFVVAEENEKGPVMVGAKGGGIRDYGDARNDGLSAGVREAGLSSRRGEHRKRRGECITQFHRVLGRMPLKYSYSKMVDDVGEQGLCSKGGKLLLCDNQHFR